MAEIAGLKLIVPTSVAGSGVSVSASGKVTFTNETTTISVNGVFSSTYDNYLIVVRATNSTGAGGMLFRLRASGADASGSNYTYQYLLANSTSVTGARSASQTFGQSTPTRTLAGGDHIYIYGPHLAQPTAFRSVNVAGGTGSDPIIFEFANTHSLSTSYDGFSLIPAASYPSTGALTVYGLSQ